jgi:hypothetical protein
MVIASPDGITIREVCSTFDGSEPLGDDRVRKFSPEVARGWIPMFGQ